MKNQFLITWILLTIFSLLIMHHSFSQSPDIEWQNNIGGYGYDYFQSLQQTEDGGYIIGGHTTSGNTGDKTEVLIGGIDYWILKLDPSGNIEWQNSIGGSGNDVLHSVKETTDGGYIAGGTSSSGISGDKLEAFLGGSPYGDCWVVKLDSSGVIEWQNTFGGSGSDVVYDIQQTYEGGYIIAASSRSGISADKSEIYQGGSFWGDYWVVKLDSAGFIEWDNTIGGSGDDYLYIIQQLNDGGFILGGSSSSGISGDKTEANLGSTDYWLVKIDSSGVIEWQRTIGGSDVDQLHSIQQTYDGGYILGGNSHSGISGDKTEAGLGYYDFWVVKVDSLGVIEWQNTIGGNDFDELFAIQQTIDSGYILGGYSLTEISGDKTENAIGQGDFWIVKINSSGEIEWQDVIGGSGHDLLYSLEKTVEGGYILGGSSTSNISGDKTENHFGSGSSQDYWIVKLYPECIESPEICNSLDDNCNGLIDDGVTETISISAAGATIFCKGGSVVLNATATSPNYQWKKNGINIPGANSSAFTVTTKGIYNCETASTCDTALSEEIIVNVQKNPPAIITAGGPVSFCAGSSVVLTANAGAGLSYQWYKGGNAIAGATSINYTVTIAGNYKCRVTKTGTGCFKNSNNIIVTVPCKQEYNIYGNKDFIIYPNPNNGTFVLNSIISFKGSSPLERGRGVTLEINNSLGQLIYSKEISSTDGVINEAIQLNDVASGIYFVRIINDAIQIEQKLIIE